MLKRIMTTLGMVRHDFREKGTGKKYSDKSAGYICVKCDHELYVPLGMQEMLIMSGCKGKRKS